MRPSFHPKKVRLAQPDDIDRTALVAGSGFYYSPANEYERPFRDKYARDTYESYRHELRKCMWDPKRILVVIDATFNQNEDEKLYPALKAEFAGRAWPRKDGKVVVGFACLSLRQDSSRTGTFQPQGALLSTNRLG